MKEVVRLNSFKKDFRRIPPPIKKAFHRQMLRLVENPDHPSLNLKKMAGYDDIWRCKLTAGYRFTFSTEGDVIFLRRIGPHDILKTP